ncbi:MAG: ribosome recycling factor [Candidatus Hinthialibacter antarcticus]|nr:ribosome recycling factor [Candidatus Hinthialibacter antarcticus]
MDNEFLEECQLEFEDAVDWTRRELSHLRTGRATPALLDSVMVEAYGTKTPLKQMANISVPEARMLVVQPWDKSQIGEIEKAILQADVGITPNNDGKIIRLPIPALTEERRRDLVKVSKKFGEEGKIRIRHKRRESVESLKKSQKDGLIPEDDAKKMEDDVQKLTEQYTKKVDDVLDAKEKEIMEF